MKKDQYRYLQRINYSGSTDPSLTVLQNLQEAHLYAVPFENLDIHIGRAIELEVSKLFSKIVEQNRGGFCYELNGLFFELLLELGFDAHLISARVFDGQKKYGREFDHLAILVKIEGEEYLCDVGFGAFAMRPLNFKLNEIQIDPNGDFVFDVFEGDYFRVNKLVDGRLKSEYIFQVQERNLSDFTEMCKFHQSSPQSHFTKKRMISKPLPDGRITLAGNTLKIKTGELVKEIILSNELEFDQALWDYFKVKI